MCNHIELQESGLVCDNPNCDWEDKTISFENCKDWINKPCPKCGENLLTEHDYKNAERVNLAMRLMNSLSDEEILQLAALVDPEDLKEHDCLKDAVGLEFLAANGDLSVSVKIDTHNEVRITEIKPEPKPKDCKHNCPGQCRES